MSDQQEVEVQEAPPLGPGAVITVVVEAQENKQMDDLFRGLSKAIIDAGLGNAPGASGDELSSIIAVQPAHLLSEDEQAPLDRLQESPATAFFIKPGLEPDSGQVLFNPLIFPDGDPLKDQQ